MHQIGVGVLGPVFRTYEPSEARLVAVKAFHLDITPEQARTLVEALERLIATALAHPGVVAPLAVGLEGDVPYLAQEYVAAESLDVAIRHYSSASIGTAMPFIRQMAAAVDAAHERGVVHGALHLRDIFVTPDEASVTGFGIVRALEEIGLAGPIRRPYTAPEVIAGRGWDAAADRFALAAIAYELLTGRRAAGTGDQVTERIRSIDGVSDPEHLEEVFATALADDPEDRYSSANRFVSALEFGAGEEPTDTVGVEPEVNRRSDTAPLDLLAGLELHHQDPAVDQTLDSVEQVESTVLDEPDDEVIRPADQNIEPPVSTIDLDESELDNQADNQNVWSGGDPVEFSLDATRAGDAAEDGGAELEFQVNEFSNNDDDGVVPVDAECYGDIAAGDRADLEVIDPPVVSDQRYVVGGPEEEDDDGEGYRDAMPILPPQTEEAYHPRSVWSRTVVPVLAVVIVVGSIAYLLGVAFATNEGPIDRVPETQSAALDPADMADRELSDELVEAGAAGPAVDAAAGAPARPSNPAAETLSNASAPIESGSDRSPRTGPAPEPAAVSERCACPQQAPRHPPCPRWSRQRPVGC
jgi:serine/threonine protein kinase